MVMVRPSMVTVGIPRFIGRRRTYLGPLGRIHLGAGATLDGILKKLERLGGDINRLSAVERQLARKFWAELELTGKAAAARKAGDVAGALAFEKKLAELRAGGFKLSDTGESHFRDFLKKEMDERSRRGAGNPGPKPPVTPQQQAAAVPGLNAADKEFNDAKLNQLTRRAAEEMLRRPGATPEQILQATAALRVIPPPGNFAQRVLRTLRRNPVKTLLGGGLTLAGFGLWIVKTAGFPGFLYEEGSQASGFGNLALKGLERWAINPYTSDADFDAYMKHLKEAQESIETTLEQADTYNRTWGRLDLFNNASLIEFNRASRESLKAIVTAREILPRVRQQEKEARARRLQETGIDGELDALLTRSLATSMALKAQEELGDWVVAQQFIDDLDLHRSNAEAFLRKNSGALDPITRDAAQKKIEAYKQTVKAGKLHMAAAQKRTAEQVARELEEKSGKPPTPNAIRYVREVVEENYIALHTGERPAERIGSEAFEESKKRVPDGVTLEELGKTSALVKAEAEAIERSQRAARKAEDKAEYEARGKAIEAARAAAAAQRAGFVRPPIGGGAGAAAPPTVIKGGGVKEP